MSAAPQQKPPRSYQLSGYYKAKGAALRDGTGQIDRRKTEDRQLLRDREAFRKACRGKNYSIKRRELWQIAERLKRILNRIDPIIFARSSLINKRRNVVMPMALDYLRVVTAYQDAITKAFDGLPDTKPSDDPMERLRRKLKRQSRQSGNGADVSQPVVDKSQ